MKSRKLRKFVNTIMGFDGQKLETMIEEMKWGQKFPLLIREANGLGVDRPKTSLDTILTISE